MFKPLSLERLGHKMSILNVVAKTEGAVFYPKKKQRNCRCSHPFFLLSSHFGHVLRPKKPPLRIGKCMRIPAIRQPCGYGSIPINTIFRGMNIHLPAILMFTRDTRFWHTAMYEWSSLVALPRDMIMNHCFHRDSRKLCETFILSHRMIDRLVSSTVIHTNSLALSMFNYHSVVVWWNMLNHKGWI